MVQQLRQHQHSVILEYNVNCYCLLPLLQLQQKLVLARQFFLISDDIIDNEGGTVADTTQSTLYEETTSGSEPESDLSVEKQQTYLVFESALLLLFSICFMCRSMHLHFY